MSMWTFWSGRVLLDEAFDDPTDGGEFVGVDEVLDLQEPVTFPRSDLLYCECFHARDVPSRRTGNSTKSDHPIPRGG